MHRDDRIADALLVRQRLGCLDERLAQLVGILGGGDLLVINVDEPPRIVVRERRHDVDALGRARHLEHGGERLGAIVRFAVVVAHSFLRKPAHFLSAPFFRLTSPTDQH